MTNHAKFMAHIHGIMPDDQASQVELAYLLAKKMHKEQVRKEKDKDGKPIRYFEHLRRATLALMHEAGVVDPTLIISTLLHDTVEDVAETHLMGVLLDKLFGAEVAGLVRSVSKMPKQGYLDRLKAHKDPRVILIKSADRLDNLRSLPKEDMEFSQRQCKETREVYLPMFYQRVPELSDELQSCELKLITAIENQLRMNTISAAASVIASPFKKLGNIIFNN